MPEQEAYEITLSCKTETPIAAEAVEAIRPCATHRVRRKGERMSDEYPLVTIDGAVALIRERTGIPIPKSRIHKDSALGIAPKPAAIYGNSRLREVTG